MKDRVLVVGSCGQVGNYVVQRAQKRGYDVHGTFFEVHVKEKNRHYCDITKYKEMFETFDKIKPKVMIFPAFNPHVDFCETHPEVTKKTNLDPIPHVLEYCKKNSIKFVYYSSDYVFDGVNGPYSEDVPPSPLSVYGKQKLQVETWIKDTLSDYIIARITWAYGWEFLGKNFVVRIVNNLRNNKEATIPSDQIANPSYAGNIADLTLDLVEKDYNGIINIGDSDRMSRAEFASRIAKFHGCDESLIIPTKTSDLNQPANRPLNGGFILDKLESVLGKKMSTLQESLKKMEAEKGLYDNIEIEIERK